MHTWFKWFDGKEHVLLSGINFNVSVGSFRQQAYAAARRHGVRVTVKSTFGGVRLRSDSAAYGPLKPGRPPGIFTYHENKVAAGHRAKADREFERTRLRLIHIRDANVADAERALRKALDEAEQAFAKAHATCRKAIEHANALMDEELLVAEKVRREKSTCPAHVHASHSVDHD